MNGLRESDLVRKLDEMQREIDALKIRETPFPFWTAYTPTITGYSANPTGGVYRYCVVGKICHYVIRENGAGTSNAATLTITLPLTAATITNALWVAPAVLLDNGAFLTTYGRGLILSGGTVITMGINAATSGGFTTSGNKAVTYCGGFYEIA